MTLLKLYARAVYRLSYDSHIDKLPNDIWDNYKASPSSIALTKVENNNKAIFGTTAPKKNWKIPSAKDI